MITAKKMIISMTLSSIVLSGCSGNLFKSEKKEKEEKQSQMAEQKERAEKEKEIYKKLEKPIDEVIKENDLDQENVQESVEVVEKDEYTDANEFAKYAGKILYEFYTSIITPEQYFNFLTKYGSNSVLQEYKNKDQALVLLTTIQDMYKKQNITGESYTVTEVTYNRFEKEGSFYRKVLTNNGEEFFITTISKEGEVWKYEEDSPSPPFIEGTEQNTETTETEALVN